MLAFEPLTTAPEGAAEALPRPFAALAGSVGLIVAITAGFVVFSSEIGLWVSGLSQELRARPGLFGVAVVVAVAMNLFEALVHVLNAMGLWFNRALLRSPLWLRLSQHVEHLEARPRLGEYLTLNAFDVVAFAAAFAVSGRFDAWWALVFAPHLATMLLAAWRLDVFLKIFLLDLRRYLPASAVATGPGRAVLRGHLFVRGAFVLTDAVVRCYLCGLIVLSAL